MVHAARKVVAVAFILAGSTFAFAQSDTKVESSRAVKSPDGTKSVMVDRFTPVVDGEPERFSGRMLVRVTATDGSPVRQRYIEASQVRVIQPPVWIDDSKICAFVYNVAKNSNGIVYFNPETNRALQVEFVMPTRNMAASGMAEQELTSLEVTEFSGAETFKIRNIPWNGGSAFPLVLPELPAFNGQPYDATFLNQLNTALESYKTFLKTNGVESLEPEQASESFTADESWLGLLACAGADSYLVGIPLTPGEHQKVLDRARIVKVKNLSLSCSQHAAGETNDQPMVDSRYLTQWSDASHLQVVEESYGAESETPVASNIVTLDVKSGDVKEHPRNAVAATTVTQSAVSDE